MCRITLAKSTANSWRCPVRTAIPYSLYDPKLNAGYVFVGTSADTPEFAVDAIAWWWRIFGQANYPGAPELLILADGGGSNGYRPRLWKYELQYQLADVFNLGVTVCHYPTGASKWNWVEHRLFSAISANRAGEPLSSYAKMLNFLNATTTQQGLVVKATLCETQYQTGLKISDEQMESVNLHKHDTLPQWNYTIRPAGCASPLCSTGQDTGRAQPLPGVRRARARAKL